MLDERIGDQRLVCLGAAADAAQAEVVLRHRQMPDLPGDVRRVLGRMPEPLVRRQIVGEILDAAAGHFEALDGGLKLSA